VFIYLELLLAISCGAASLKLLATGLFRRYKCLSAYLVFYFLYTIGLLIIGDVRSPLYMKYWVISEPFLWLFYVLTILELYSLVLEKHQGLYTLGKWFLYTGLSVSVLISLLTLLPHLEFGRIQRSGILSYFYPIERGLDFSLLVFLLFIMILLTRYPVPLSRNVIIHSITYSAFFFSNALAMFARVIFGLTLSRTVSTFALGVSTACSLIWFFLLTPGGEHTQVRVPWISPQHEGQILSHLDSLNATMLKISQK
jgi:hypothetical protein